MYPEPASETAYEPQEDVDRTGVSVSVEDGSVDADNRISDAPVTEQDTGGNVGAVVGGIVGAVVGGIVGVVVGRAASTASSDADDSPEEAIPGDLPGDSTTKDDRRK